MIRFLRRFLYIFVLCCVPLFFAGFAFAEDDPTADDFDIVEHVLIAYHGDTAHVVIPSDVIAIGDEAFAHNGSVLSVVIPEGCTAVGNLAFFDCANLKSVALPASLISIGANGFNATGLTSVQLPGDLISIGESAFFQCSALSSMDIPDSVESIGADAFRWSGIEYLIVGHETTAEAYAIENSIPYQYRGTEEILYPPEFVIVDGVLKAYNGDGGSILLIPEGVQAIGEEAFNKHVEIEEIVIPEGVTEIRAGAFFGLQCLKEVSFPSTLTVIADNAFYACKLIDINLPEDLTTIGRNAFYDHNCANEIYIPSSVQFIGEGAFRSLQLHPVLVVEEDSEGVEYALDDGLAYRILGEVNIVYPPEFVIDSAGVLTRYNGDGGAVSIPDTVRVIADEVFYDNNSITAVTIPEGVERIGSYSFFGCMQLTELHIPSTVTYLAPDSFGCCYGLKRLYFAEGITEVGEASFRVCSALEYISFPGTLLKIGERAFEQILSIDTIEYNGTVQEWTNITIEAKNDCITSSEVTFLSEFSSEDINIEYYWDEDVAEIGKPFVVHYSVSGGSGVYTRLRIDGTLIDGDRTISGSVYVDVDEPSGTCSIIPYTGRIMNLYVFVTDSEGRIQSKVNSIPIVPNKDYPVQISFNKQEVSIGDEIQADYVVVNSNSLSSAEAIWIVREKGDYEDEDDYSWYQDTFTKGKRIALTESQGTVSFVPQFGDDLTLMIKGITDTGVPIYYQSNSVLVTGSEDIPIDIDVIDKDDIAVLGKPYHISYRVQGGTGIYESIEFDGTQISADNTVLNSALSITTQAEGEIEIVPDNGNRMILYIFVNDSNGKRTSWHADSDVTILPNQEYPIDCELSKSSICIGESLTAEYSISNVERIEQGLLYWIIGERTEYQDWYSYSGRINSTIITSPSGFTSVKPVYGDFVQLVLSGKTPDGSPIYYTSEKIWITNDRIILPKGLKTIGKESFMGCTFSEIVIPDTVEFIDSEAIPHTCIIRCSKNSYAYRWATENGYSVADP